MNMNVGRGHPNPDAGDLAVTAGWGHGGKGGRTALRLVRDWIDLRVLELGDDWELARAGRDLNEIEPLK